MNIISNTYFVVNDNPEIKLYFKNDDYIIEYWRTVPLNHNPYKLQELFYVNSVSRFEYFSMWIDLYHNETIDMIESRANNIMVKINSYE